MEKWKHNPNGSERVHEDEIRARCGFLCSSCQAYSRNIHDDRDRDRVHTAWKKIYGLDIPQEILCCDGCLKPDTENPHRIGGDCPIRTCVLERGLDHCGYCVEFPCDLMEKHLTSVETAEPVQKNSIAEEDFRDFIDPYLCRKFLETLQDR